METMTYAETGVNYEAMDPFKRLCQRYGRITAGNITHLNEGEFQEYEASRGESVYLIETAKSYLAHVHEGLGTKNLVADRVYAFTTQSFDDNIAQDTVAMGVNDMITLGAQPLSVAMHLAVAESSWFGNRDRVEFLVKGWSRACDLANCAWGGGETPTLKGVIVPGVYELSVSVMGIIQPKERLIAPGKIQAGDAIVIIESSGIGANGLTLARKIADKLEFGYSTELPDGTTYGETLLEPTHIYVSDVIGALDDGVNIHGAINVTGHGWRKFMRAAEPFTYIIDTLPTQLGIFDFIQKHGPVDNREAYGTFNMGAGFALYVPESQASRVIEICRIAGHRAFVAGHIKKGDKKVVIKPMSLEFAGETLAIR